MAKRGYEYDVALSYAGENERFVRQVYRHLTAADLKVFFAPRRTAQLWGKDEREFEHIYGPGSRFVVPFISEHYATKEWPRLEFKAARKEAQNRPGEFILPVRLDSTKMRGLPAKLQYVDGRRVKPRAIATMLVEEKLGASLPARRMKPGANGAAPQVVDQYDADLLALVATAMFPFGVRELQQLVPNANWRDLTKRWRRRGWIRRGRGLEIATELRRTLFRHPDAERRAHERWSDVLLPLRHHSDAALALGLHYLFLRRASDMLDVLIPIADALEPGFFNDLYLNVFEKLQKTPHIRSAPARVRVRFLNGYGLLLARNGRHADALRQFAKLRILSRRTSDAWGEGQSFINAGVAAAHAGDDRAAAAWYAKAITHARRHRDRWLLARALGNLAHFVDLDQAAKLLDESEQLKIRVGDVEGLGGTLMARGNLAAASGDFRAAGRFYRRAAALGRRLDLRYLRAMALRNLGRTEVDRAQPKNAIPLYRMAREIAEQERFADQLPHIVAGEAIAHAEAQQYKRAENLFQELVAIDTKRGDHSSAVVAFHDVGAMQVMQKRRADAYDTFMKVIGAATNAGAREWVYRTQIDAASVAPSGARAFELLRSARRAALRAHDYERAVFCSVHIAEWHLAHNAPEEALRELAATIRVAPADAKLALMSDRFALLLETRASDRRAGRAFRELVREASEAGDHERVVDAHMALGDALWARDTMEERANAYQAYVAAFVPAMRISFETFLRVGVHAATRLHRLFRREDELEELDRIERETHAWLSRQHAARRHHDLVLWPLQLARRILARDDAGEHVTGKEMTAMLTDELERGTRISLRRSRAR